MFKPRSRQVPWKHTVEYLERNGPSVQAFLSQVRKETVVYSSALKQNYYLHSILAVWKHFFIVGQGCPNSQEHSRLDLKICLNITTCH